MRESASATVVLLRDSLAADGCYFCLSAADSCLFHPGVPIFHDALKVSLGSLSNRTRNSPSPSFGVFVGLVLLSEENDRFLRVPLHQGEKWMVVPAEVACWFQIS